MFGNCEIYVMNADGTGQTNRSNNPAWDYDPAWSPPTPSPTPTPTPGPGEMRNCPERGKWSIVVWDGADGVDTGEALDTCGEGAVDAAYALDPDSQGWQGYFPGRIELSKKLTVKANEGFIAHASHVTVARIAFMSTYRDGSNTDIYVMNANGTGVTRLTDDPAPDEYPAWSPDRSKIAFASNRDGNWEIYVMNADGTGQTNLTNDPAIDHSPAWSP